MESSRYFRVLNLLLVFLTFLFCTYSSDIMSDPYINMDWSIYHPVECPFLLLMKGVRILHLIFFCFTLRFYLSYRFVFRKKSVMNHQHLNWKKNLILSCLKMRFQILYHRVLMKPNLKEKKMVKKKKKMEKEARKKLSGMKMKLEVLLMKRRNILEEKETERG